MFYFLDFTVKEEPGDNRDELHPSDLVLATHNISASDEIVLNVSSADEVIDSIKSEPIDLEAEDVESGIAEVPTVIIPWPAFVPVASHPELAGARRKRKTAAAAVTAGGSSSPVITAGEKRSRSRLEDVTSQYSEEDMDENQVERGGGRHCRCLLYLILLCLYHTVFDPVPVHPVYVPTKNTNFFSRNYKTDTKGNRSMRILFMEDWTRSRKNLYGICIT